jgi:SAM-dependent methyltransferase
MTDYGRYEILVATNLIEDTPMRDYCKANGLNLVEVRDGYYSKMNNEAVRKASGEFIVFLNDDTLIKTSCWIRELLGLCNQREVGAVAPKLILPDGRIQMTRMVLGIRRDGMPYFFDPFAANGTFMFHGFSSEVISDVSAVSGACMMMRRAIFLEMGGFDEKDYNLSWQDIDLCFRLRHQGFAILYTPHAVVVHQGSHTLKSDLPMMAKSVLVRDKFFQAHRAELLGGDPFYNPNLTDNHGLAEAPLFPEVRRVNVLDAQNDQSYWHSCGFPSHPKETMINDRGRSVALFMPFASNVLRATGCKRVVDIGCGPGLLLEAFQQVGVECWGIEPSSAALAVIPAEVRKRIASADITSSSVVEQAGLACPFCVAVCMEVLEHIPGEYLHQALAHMGALSDLAIVTTPKPNLWDRDDKAHVSVMPRSSWIEVFQKSAWVEDTRLGAAVFGYGYKANPDMSLFVLKRKA